MHGPTKPHSDLPPLTSINIRPETPADRATITAILIEAGLNALRGLGAQGCVLVGDPAYYLRFGFRHDPALIMEGVPPEVFMSFPLAEHHPRGRVTHHPAFSIC